MSQISQIKPWNETKPGNLIVFPQITVSQAVRAATPRDDQAQEGRTVDPPGPQCWGKMGIAQLGESPGAAWLLQG